MPKTKTQLEFTKDVEKIFGKDVEVIGKYTGNKNKILVRFNQCGHEETKTPTKLLAGQGCGKCRGKAISRAKLKSKSQYQESLVKNGITNIIMIGDYGGSKKKIHVKNTDCGHEYFANAGNVLRGSGCPICHGIKNHDMFVKIIEEKYPGEYEIIGKYSNGLTPILVKHKCGHEWKVIPKDLLRDIRCPKCISSKGELFIKEYLEQHGIEYKKEFCFSDCRDKNPLPFDFMIYVFGEMRLIEFDGVQHYRDERSIYFSQKVLRHDKIKNDYCKENNIKLIRIPYWWLRSERIVDELDKFVLNK